MLANIKKKIIFPEKKFIEKDGKMCEVLEGDNG